MKKIILVSGFLFLVSSFTAPVFAADTTPTPSLRPRQEFRRERNEIKKEFREDRQEARVTLAVQRKNLWTELKKKQVQLVSDRLLKELQARFDIVLKLKNKISERISAKSTTHDTSAASAKLAQFSDAQFQTDFTSLKTKISAITSSETPKDLLPGIRDTANVIRQDLRNLHLFLVEVMKLVATSPKK